MRRVLPILMLGLLTAIGCTKSSPQGGTPAAGSKEAFSITVPATAVSVKQGDTDQVDIAIRRGADFSNDVKVELMLPPGVTAAPSVFVFQGPTKDQKVTLTIAGDAMVGTHPVKVNATPTSGAPTSSQFDVAVKSKS